MSGGAVHGAPASGATPPESAHAAPPGRGEAGAAPAGTPLSATACPLCGGPNGCAPAACGRFDVDCWCTGVRFAPAALARVPEAQRGKACLCRACATGGGGDIPA